MDARSVRNELSKIRDVANEISSDMAKMLDKSMKPKERRDEARYGGTPIWLRKRKSSRWTILSSV